MFPSVRSRRQPLREIYVNSSNPYAPPRRPALPDALKQAIVAKHVEHPEFSYRLIGEQLVYLGRPVDRSTIRKLCDRAVTRAEAVTLSALLTATKRQKKQRRPRKILKNSELARQIYNTIHQNQQHENTPY